MGNNLNIDINEYAFHFKFHSFFLNILSSNKILTKIVGHKYFSSTISSIFFTEKSAIDT